jgi:hypothetical protein
MDTKVWKHNWASVLKVEISTEKTEPVRSSKTAVHLHQATRRHDTKSSTINIDRFVNAAVEIWWHTMTHGRGSEGETGEWSGYPVLFTLPRNMLYPALLPLMRTPRLPVVDWTDAPADLNELVRFAERQNLVYARVPSHFKRGLPSNRLRWDKQQDRSMCSIWLTRCPRTCGSISPNCKISRLLEMSLDALYRFRGS